MADSNITKMAMANSLKELMQEKSFYKISINDICTGCNMNRKSFYYHFKDKYDLLNWIFDTEFREFERTANLSNVETSLKQLCQFFYENRKFYRKALTVEGQNSFRSHLHSVLYKIVSNGLNNLFDGKEEFEEMQIQFITDGILCALMRWILSPNCITADEFMEKQRALISYLIKFIEEKHYGEN